MSSIKLLRVEDLEKSDDLYHHPSWEKVDEFLRSLDGVSVTYITLYKSDDINDDEYLTVGGGAGYYVCEYVSGGTVYYLTGDEDVKPGETINIPVRDVEEIPKKYCIRFEELYPNIRYFYEHGVLHPDYPWDKKKAK